MIQPTTAPKQGEIVTLPLALLIEDKTVYPRHDVDSVYITQLVDALQSGATLPPIVANRAGKRIVDGFHRKHAQMRVYGEEAQVQVELREYANDKEMLADAIRMNSAHGRKLDRQDRVRCVILANGMGISITQISTILHVPDSTVKEMLGRVVKVPLSTPGALPVPARKPPTGMKEVPFPTLGLMPVKRPLIHLAGTTLSSEQARAAQSAPGTPYSLLAFQLRDALHHGLVNREDEKLQQALRELRNVLITYFAEA